MFPDFFSETVFLDIETTGFYTDSVITMCGVLDIDDYKSFVRDDDLDILVEFLDAYSLIVTFNGKRFDIPRIEKECYFDIDNFVHIDLMDLMKQVGLVGGQKNIERSLDIDRGELSDLDGRAAVRLWKQYEYGNEEALETLIRYNAEDVVNLPKFAEYAYKELFNKSPVDLDDLVFPFYYDTDNLPYDYDLL